MHKTVHTSDARHFKRMWLEMGGTVQPIRQSGEVRFAHPRFPASVKANGRRKDVPAVLLTRLNQLIRAADAE